MTNKEIQIKFGTVMNLIKRRCAQIEDTSKDKSCQFTAKQGIVLGFIREKSSKGEDVFQKDIEKHFSLRRPTATGILQLMEKNNLIERQALKEDARMKKIVLTDKANQLFSKIVSVSDAITNAAFEGVTEEEKAVVGVVIDKIIANLEDK